MSIKNQYEKIELFSKRGLADKASAYQTADSSSKLDAIVSINN